MSTRFATCTVWWWYIFDIYTHIYPLLGEMIGVVDPGTVNQEIATVARAAKDPISDLHTDRVATHMRTSMWDLYKPPVYPGSLSHTISYCWPAICHCLGVSRSIGSDWNKGKCVCVKRLYLHACSCYNIYINCHNKGCSLIYNCLMYVYRLH